MSFFQRFSARSRTGATRMIWQLAWPQLLMMFFHFWLGFADVYVAGRLSDQIQASLGIITQSLFFFLVVAMALANGAVASISQSLGAKKTKRAARYAMLGIALVLLASSLLVLLAMGLSGPLLSLLRVPEEIRPITDYFLKVYLLVLPPYYLFIMGNAIFRAQKKVHLPLLAMILVTVINVLGDFGLGFGLWGLPDMGYKGLAWATFLSVSAGALFDLAILLHRGWLRPRHFPPLRWIRRGLPYLVQVAWPAGMLQILWHSGYLVIYALTASLPEGNITALAALTAGLRLESILFLPAFAFNMTASILVGHYLGAGDIKGARGIGWRTWGLGCGTITLVTACLWIAIDPLAAVLAPQASVQAETARYLTFNFLAIPFTTTSMILGGVFNGAGATRYNMQTIGGTVWLVRIPCAYILGHLVLGTATGIWAAMLVSQSIQAAIMLYLFIKKDWFRFSMHAHKLQPSTGVRHGAHFPATLPSKSK